MEVLYYKEALQECVPQRQVGLSWHESDMDKDEKSNFHLKLFVESSRYTFFSVDTSVECLLRNS